MLKVYEIHRKTVATESFISKFLLRCSSWNVTVKAEKRFTSFISNEDMNDVIKIIDSLENSGVLIDGVAETLKHEIKNNETNFLPL